MKVKFLKNHDVYSKGSAEDLPDGLANYLIQCKVVELDKPKTEPKAKK